MKYTNYFDKEAERPETPSDLEIEAKEIEEWYERFKYLVNGYLEEKGPRK